MPALPSNAVLNIQGVHTTAGTTGIMFGRNFPPLVRCSAVALRKHAYSNILKILPSKNDNFQIRNSNIFHISAQNIDCGYSLEPPR